MVGSSACRDRRYEQKIKRSRNDSHECYCRRRRTSASAAMTSGRDNTYGMTSVVHALEMDHTIQAGERGSATVISVRIELLLGDHVAAILFVREGGYISNSSGAMEGRGVLEGVSTSHEKETMVAEY